MQQVTVQYGVSVGDNLRRYRVHAWHTGVPAGIYRGKLLVVGARQAVSHIIYVAKYQIGIIEQPFAR